VIVMFGWLAPPVLARAAAAHPRRTLAVWALVLVVSLGVVGTLLGSATTTKVGFVSSPESATAARLIQHTIGITSADTEMVVVSSRPGPVTSPSSRVAIAALTRRLEALGPGVVARVTSPFLSPATLVSKDGTTALIPVTMAGDNSKAVNHVASVIAVAASAGNGLHAQVAGQAAAGHDSNAVAKRDLSKGESIGIPVALIVLLVVFGTLVSALLPIMLALVAIVVALAATALIGQAYQLSFFVTNMITMMGLAVGIDYVLFIVSRFREARQTGSTVEAAIAVASRTASRAVLFSGITVVVALVGLLIVPTSIFLSLAAGAILVVTAAVAAALTLLPAVLVLLGDRIEKGRVGRLMPSRARRAKPAGGTGFFTHVVDWVMRRPVVSLVAVSALLLAAAVPYFGISTGASGVASLPPGAPSRQAYETMQRAFPVGLLAPARIPLVGGADTPANRAQTAAIRKGVAGDPRFGAPVLEPGTTPRGAVLDVPINADPASSVATGAVKDLRRMTTLPVGGDAAQNLDYFTISSNYQPIVFALVLALSFLVLLVAFRSIVIPALAIAMNLLSVGAAYGLLTLVLQDGHGASLFGFQQVPVIEAWIPLFLFAVLFGLSMDYHVLLTSRIREQYELTGDTRRAIRTGISSSARLITGAALIMVAVFAGFSSGQLVMFQQMGFGVAVAILIDATLVRTVLVPAAMTILGRWNWYLPRALDFVPHLQVEGGEPAGGKAREELVPDAVA
jgi:RND superfamily putative drug exporter